MRWVVLINVLDSVTSKANLPLGIRVWQHSADVLHASKTIMSLLFYAWMLSEIFLTCLNFLYYLYFNESKISHSPSQYIFIECYSAPRHVRVLRINKYNPCSQVKSWILISETDSNMEIIWSLSWFQVISSTKMCCRGECTICLGKSREALEGGNTETETWSKTRWPSQGMGKCCLKLEMWHT